MPLKDLLKKKPRQATPDDGPPFIPPTDFTFMRSDTNSEEIISPPGFAGDGHSSPYQADQGRQGRQSRFRSGSNASATSAISSAGNKNEKRLSLQRLNLRRSSRASSVSSAHIPADLPDIAADGRGGDEHEAQWEKRATLLAKGGVGQASATDGIAKLSLDGLAPAETGRSRSGSVSDPTGDENIHEAIRLHEAGDLARSTAMFGRLADPEGANNALSQVLYGLALRHGWGITADLPLAVKYLSTAASHSAEIESLALQAGMKKGGAAKGELVLAIYELANCFRNGWGIAKDAHAAKQYYETAANLGDADACNEVAWCYLEGFGCKKDRFAAAKYYRLAEGMGSKTLGNSW
ncbi:MAG: hypothetical protein M1832_002094 [Thelocarpon impressellum]|nr:MAG: hypothetical protein M1832_002094 [Thelocarpon impressellum]